MLILRICKIWLEVYNMYMHFYAHSQNYFVAAKKHRSICPIFFLDIIPLPQTECSHMQIRVRGDGDELA